MVDLDLIAKELNKYFVATVERKQKIKIRIAYHLTIKRR